MIGLKVINCFLFQGIEEPHEIFFWPKDLLPKKKCEADNSDVSLERPDQGYSDHIVDDDDDDKSDDDDDDKSDGDDGKNDDDGEDDSQYNVSAK